MQRLGTSSAVDKFIRDPEHPVSFIFALVRGGVMRCRRSCTLSHAVVCGLQPEDGAAAQSEHAIFKEVAASLQSSQVRALPVAYACAWAFTAAARARCPVLRGDTRA